MTPSLTSIERKILDYMVQYLRQNTYQPSIREIGSRFSIKSTKTVSEHLQALADKGFLERDPSRSRGVKILGMDLHADTISVPCYRELPDDRVGIRTDRAEMFLTVDRRMAGSKGSFFVRATGDDLAFMGAHEGDFLLVEPVPVDEIPEGAIVVARVPEGPRFKRFSRNGRGVFLQSLRGDEDPVLVESLSKLFILGRLAALYRRLDEGGTPASLTTH